MTKQGNGKYPMEVGKLAHDLIRRGEQKWEYWRDAPDPYPVLGYVRFEWAHQLATFLVPLALLVWAHHTFGWTGTGAAFPVAWALGYWIDLQLQKRIERARRREYRVDGDRYRVTTEIARALGIQPKDVTIPLMESLCLDYLAQAKAKADRDAFVKRRTGEILYEMRIGKRDENGDLNPNYVPCLHASGDDADTNRGSAPAHEEPSVYQDDPLEHPTFDPYPNVNPATGLPMISDTAVDVGGHAFGSNS
ncbi:hypothetical protein QZM19_22790 [Burkholderia multivorans]|nr:hypothetical protein [Burkholderia multivorans]MDN7945964.1 hypothetical protein [Burkholderia multivorans]